MAALERRVFGVETEFGCLVDDESVPYESVVEAVKDHVFYELRLGAIDRQSRDEAFEPAFSGGFLINGGRLYVDAVGSHEEYATAECTSVWDLVANDRAGQRIIVRALKELGLDETCNFYNNSVDHFGGHTFGCHENYSIRADDQFLSDSVHLLYPFLVTRQIFAGVGRVGGHIIDYAGQRISYQEVSRNPVDYIWVSNVYGVQPDSSIKFQLSQRADHIIKTIASRVRFNRALINPKWESFYATGNTTRLHLLFGEANQMHYAYALKIATTCLVLDLIEDGLVPHQFRLLDPLETLRSVSRDDSLKWVCTMEDGTTIRAVDLHRQYLSLAERYRGRDKQTDWALANWASTLDALESDPLSLSDKLDWVAKRAAVEKYIEACGCDWQSDALHSVDLEYHNIDPQKSLFEPIDSVRLVDESAIVNAMTDPPTDTRAYGRAALVRRLVKTREHSYWVDWDAVFLDRQTAVHLSDPLNPYSELATLDDK